MLYLNFHGVGEPGRGIGGAERTVWLNDCLFADMLRLAVGREDVGLSFDDGNLSDLVVALPCLQRLGLRAEFFVCAGRIGQVGYLGASELRMLCEAGMSVGSHGWAHLRWHGLTSAELHTEIIEAKDRIEQTLGQPVQAAACPFGSYGRRALAMLHEAGFTRVYTSDRGLALPTGWLRPRNAICMHDTLASVSRLLDGTASKSGPFTALKRLLKRWR